jgi:UDP:flavonoid glycosyltransferase YjiC (YdhE family)
LYIVVPEMPPGRPVGTAVTGTAVTGTAVRGVGRLSALNAGLRVLMSTWGWRTHLNCLVALGWALQAAGHEVRMASHPSITDAITATGIAAVPVGPDHDFGRMLVAGMGRVRPRPHDGPGTVEPEITGAGVTVRCAEAMLDDLIQFGRAWQPDLVIWDPLNVAAAVAAPVLKVPGVFQRWGPDQSALLRIDADDVFGPLVTRYGLTAADVSLNGSLTLDPAPPPMQVPAAPPGLPVRYVPYNGKAVVPDWLREPASRPRVCVTAGTMMATVGFASSLDLSAITRAVAELDVEVIVASDPRDTERLGPVPSNVRVAATPLAHRLVLPSCSAFVHQGGGSSTMTGVACGVPQLILPQVSDQHLNAERVAVTGAGTWLDPADATAAGIRDLVGRLVHDSTWSAAAALMHERVQQMPAPAQMVPVLEELAAGKPS